MIHYSRTKAGKLIHWIYQRYKVINKNYTKIIKGYCGWYFFNCKIKITPTTLL